MDGAVARRRWRTRPAASAAPCARRALVNAAGPWVADVLDRIPDDRITAKVRLVKGSHIIVPKVHSQGHAYILQNADDRVVFVIPYEGQLQPDRHDRRRGGRRSPRRRAITAEETQYLLDAANRFLAKPLSRGRRRLELRGRAAALRRRLGESLGGHARLRAQGRPRGAARRRCSRSSAARSPPTGAWPRRRWRSSSPSFPGLKGDWTATEPLPGGDVGALQRLPRRDARASIRSLPRDLVEGVVRRHGSRTPRVLGEAQRLEDLGTHFGAGLTAARGRLPARRGMGAHRRGRPVAPHQVRACTWTRAQRAAVARLPALKPLAEFPRAASAAIRGVLTDIDDTLTTARPPAARGLRGAGALRAAGPAGDPGHRPPRGLVRPHRAHVAGGRGGGRERRLLVPPRREGRPAGEALRDRTTRSARSARARLDAIAERILARGARLRHRLGPAATAKPTSRSTSARTCRRCRARRSRAHRRDHGGRGPHREGELDPRERLVRRLRQALDHARS